ncbi:MAG TPA: hypothetical protein GXZ61_06620 [Clostridiales bacterium]|nr:hypothetical protein [Clostridiales bacterium]
MRGNICASRGSIFWLVRIGREQPNAYNIVEKGCTLTAYGVPTDHCIDMDGGCFGEITGWEPLDPIGLAVGE